MSENSHNTELLNADIRFIEKRMTVGQRYTEEGQSLLDAINIVQFRQTSLKYKNGQDVEIGDVIRWNSYDSDDHVTYTFTGIVTQAGVVYLGGGIDNGIAIGNIMSFEEVQEEANDNDGNEAGIEKIGNSKDLAKHISKFIVECRYVDHY